MYCTYEYKIKLQDEFAPQPRYSRSDAHRSPIVLCTEYDSTHKKPYTQLPGSRSFYSFRELTSGQREKQTAPKTRYITKSQRGRERKALPFQLSYCPHLGECLCSVWPIERHLHKVFSQKSMEALYCYGLLIHLRWKSFA